MVKGECLLAGGYRLGFKLALDRTHVPRVVQRQVKGCLPENLKTTTEQRNPKQTQSVPCPFLGGFLWFCVFLPVPEGRNFHVFHRGLVSRCNLPAKFMNKLNCLHSGYKV